MKKFLKSDLFRETVSYIIVGATATVVSFAFQFLFTTIILPDFVAESYLYFISSVLSFIVSSPVSFFLNRKFTFKADKLPLGKTLVRFYMIVVPCFLLSYFVLRPLTSMLFTAIDLPWQQKYITFAEQIVANCVYIVINYLGQKFFTFKKDKDNLENDAS